MTGILNFETSDCSAEVDRLSATLDIRFSLSSAGGGSTSVLVCIGKDDFQVILNEIATLMPGSAGILADCAWKAIKKNLESVPGLWKVADLEEVRADGMQARAEKLVEDLQVVKEFVNEKWAAKPGGKDKRESQVKDALEAVMDALEYLE